MNIETNKKLSFHNDIINLYKKISKDLKYKPTKLLDMINKYGGYEAAIKYITSESNTFDFTVLWENERLDLSVEALITNPKHRELFPEEILSFCDKKLKDYNFSPKKIEVKKEAVETVPLEITKPTNIDISSSEKAANVKDYTIYNQPLEIDKNTWKELFINNTVFTDKNKDLVLRIYLIDGSVESQELAIEDGYTSKYPYKEVILALGKRIKMKVKIDVPKSKGGELLWWHLPFVGWFKDNQHFEWCVRPELRKAIGELIEEGKVGITDIKVKTEHSLEEGLAKFEEAETEVYNAPKVEEKVSIATSTTEIKKETKKTTSAISGKNLGELSEEELEEFFLGSSKKTEKPVIEEVSEEKPVHKEEFDSLEGLMGFGDLGDFEPSLEDLLAIEKESTKNKTKAKTVETQTQATILTPKESIVPKITTTPVIKSEPVTQQPVIIQEAVT